MSHRVSIRTFAVGDEDNWLRLVREAYGSLDSRSLDDIRQLVNSEDFSSNWLFLAEADQKMIGCIRVKPLPRKDYYELWDLAVSRKYRQSRVPSLLVENALSYLGKEGAQFVRGYTLSTEPYVSTYKNHGFKPARRILRIDWDLNEELPWLHEREDISVKEAFSYDPEKIASIFVRSLTPFWDWWVEDHNGLENLTRLSKGWFSGGGDRLRWFVAESKKGVVGLTGFTLGKGNVGRFIGVYVLPEHRMGRIGSTLMQVVLKKARETGLRTLRVFTVAFLDRLAPGALLYLKSGGRITAEYLQLEMS